MNAIFEYAKGTVCNCNLLDLIESAQSSFDVSQNTYVNIWTRIWSIVGNSHKSSIRPYAINPERDLNETIKTKNPFILKLEGHPTSYNILNVEIQRYKTIL